MVLASIGWQPTWWSILQSTFMRHAFIGGTLLAVAAGMIGYFVVIRQSAFAAHALAHVGFPGATGAVLVGAPVIVGLAVFTIGGGLVIGALGRRAATREVATGRNPGSSRMPSSTSRRGGGQHSTCRRIISYSACTPIEIGR